MLSREAPRHREKQQVGSEVRFLEQSGSLLIDDLARLGERMVDGRLQVAVLIGANKLNPFRFTVYFAADETGSTILAVFVYRGCFDAETLVVDRLRWLGLAVPDRTAKQ